MQENGGRCEEPAETHEHRGPHMGGRTAKKQPETPSQYPEASCRAELE